MTSQEQKHLAILTEYSEFLEKHGYMDSDWWCEEPKAIDRFLEENDKAREVKAKLNKLKE